MKLSQEQNTYSDFFFLILNIYIKFKAFARKDDPRSWCISGNNGFEKYGYTNV